MKEQLENIIQQLLKRCKDLKEASCTNSIDENHNLDVVNLPSGHGIVLYEV